MYQWRETPQVAAGEHSTALLEVVTVAQLTTLVEFAKGNVGAEEVWVRPYYRHLILRGELFALWRDGCVMAAGECRGFEHVQLDYADLGVIVEQSVRREGLASAVLGQLVTIAQSCGLKPI